METNNVIIDCKQNLPGISPPEANERSPITGAKPRTRPPGMLNAWRHRTDCVNIATMKALLLTNEYPPHVYGGAGVHVDYFSRELAKTMPVLLLKVQD